MGSFFLKLVTSGFLDKLLTYYTNKDNVDGEVAKKHIEAEIERRKVQERVIAIEHGWWVTAWIRPLVVYPFVLHLWAIMIDTVFSLGWGIPALPGVFHDLEIAILMSYFITRPVEKGLRGYFSQK